MGAREQALKHRSKAARLHEEGIVNPTYAVFVALAPYMEYYGFSEITA